MRIDLNTKQKRKSNSKNKNNLIFYKGCMQAIFDSLLKKEEEEEEEQIFSLGRKISSLIQLL